LRDVWHEVLWQGDQILLHFEYPYPHEERTSIWCVELCQWDIFLLRGEKVLNYLRSMEKGEPCHPWWAHQIKFTNEIIFTFACLCAYIILLSGHVYHLQTRTHSLCSFLSGHVHSVANTARKWKRELKKGLWILIKGVFVFCILEGFKFKCSTNWLDELVGGFQYDCQV
jgi:hypothetical protein